MRGIYLRFNLFRVQIPKAGHWSQTDCLFRHEQILSDYLHHNRLLTCHAKHVAVLFGSEPFQKAAREYRISPRQSKVFY